MYSLCKNAWHLIDKIFSWIYLIKFLEIRLRYLSDLHSYRKYQNYLYRKREHSGTMAKNKIRFEKYTAKRILCKKATHKPPS